MSRQLKFRAWDETNKLMEYNVNVNQGKAVKRGYQWYSNGNTVHDSKLMQYIGLKDKNGVEIYEGDIVEATRYDGLAVTGVVDFRDCSFVISTGYQTIYTWIDYQIEVIGNVWEQPELLKESEE